MLFPVAWLIQNTLTVLLAIGFAALALWQGDGDLIGLCFYGGIIYGALWNWSHRYLRERRMRRGLRPPKPRKEKRPKPAKPQPVPVVRQSVPVAKDVRTKDYCAMLLTLPKGLQPFIEGGLNETADRMDAEREAGAAGSGQLAHHHDV